MTRGSRIIDADGSIATCEGPAGTEGHVVLRLPSGQHTVASAASLHEQPDGSYRLSTPFAHLDEVKAVSETLLEVEERLHVHRDVREVGRTQVRRSVSEERHIVDEPVRRERVTVERVPIGTYVDHPAPTRQEGDVTIIPVYEEVLVVEKRLLLKEEVRVERHSDEIRNPQEVVLRKAEVEVEHLSPSAEPSHEEAGDHPNHTNHLTA